MSQDDLHPKVLRVPSCWGCLQNRALLVWHCFKKTIPTYRWLIPRCSCHWNKKTNAEHVFSRCVSLKLVPPTEKHGTRVSPHFGENDHCTTTLVWSNLDCVSWGWGVPFKFSEAPKTTKQNAQHNHDLRAPQISGTQHIHTYSFYDLNTCINNSKLPHVPTQYYHAFGKLLRALPMPNKKNWEFRYPRARSKPLQGSKKEDLLYPSQLLLLVALLRWQNGLQIRFFVRWRNMGRRQTPGGYLGRCLLTGTKGLRITVDALL